MHYFKMKYKYLIAACTLFAPVLAYAECADFYPTWLQSLHPNRTIDTEHATCKPWPANPALTLAALPLQATDGTDGTKVYDLDILVADSASGTVIAHLYWPAAIESDAIRLSSISFDTARYRLSPDNRAFGVRITHEGSSRVSPYELTSLSLFTVDGQTLRAVLDRLIIEQSVGEWDGRCAGEFDRTSRTIDMGPPGRDGFASLKISEKSTKTTDTLKNDECVSKDKAAGQSSIVIDYRNGRYGIPKGMQLD